VFVFPTLSDGFGIVLLEAMAAGVPVISTRNCGAVVRDGENGFIVPARDAQAIAERIEQITTDRNLRERLSRGAIATATQFSLTQYKERLVSAIRHAAI
jgi:glycosyltransferase involved in cell wall biosynthesis